MPDEILAADNWRLFIALPLPGEVKERLQVAQSALRRSIPRADVRWSRVDQMHLTLVFLGNVAATRVADLTEAVRTAAARFGTFSLSSGQVGFFPDQGSPRVIWVGVEDAGSQLVRLQKELAITVESFVERPENKPFTAHLTLARVNRLSSREFQTVRQAATESRNIKPSTWQATTIQIMRSELSSQGAKHECLAELPFSSGRNSL